MAEKKIKPVQARYAVKANGKAATGRPSKYDPAICDRIVAWFDKEPYELDIALKRVPNPLPTFEKFAHSEGLSCAILYVWKNEHPEFLEAFKKAQELQKDFWIANSLLGLYPPGFACFAGKNMFDWRDKQEVAHSGNVTLNITKDDAECL